MIEHIQHLVKSMHDPIYFIEHEFHRLKDDLLTLHYYQKKMVMHIHDNSRARFRVCRRAGTTTVLAAYAVWLAVNKPNQTIFIYSNALADAYEFLKIVKLALENLGNRHNINLETNNKYSITLNNDSKIMAGNSCVARGYSLDLLIVDNADFCDLQGIYDLLPAMSSSPTSKMVTVGGDFDFPTMTVTWKDIPDFDEKWKSMIIQNIGEDNFNQSFAMEESKG
jgi:hypothetical protein